MIFTLVGECHKDWDKHIGQFTYALRVCFESTFSSAYTVILSCNTRYSPIDIKYFFILQVVNFSNCFSYGKLHFIPEVALFWGNPRFFSCEDSLRPCPGMLCVFQLSHAFDRHSDPRQRVMRMTSSLMLSQGRII